MAGGVICLFLSGYQYWELQFEVNERLPQGQKFEPLFWTLGTHLRFRELRKQVFPSSPRPKRSLHFAIAGFCLFFPGVAVLVVSLK
jgi:hypothetical protein